MNRLKGRMLAVVLATATLLSSVTPVGALAAEPAEADTSAEAFTAASEIEPAETEEGDMKEEGEMTAEGSGADEAGEAAAEENGEESEPAENMEEEQEENEDEVGKAEGESSGETADPETGSGEGATQAAPSEPGEEGGQSEGTETAAPAAEEEKEPADGEEEIAMGRFAVRFGSEGGIVKVIVSTDEGASEDDPSYILEKTDGGVRVTERSGASYTASETEEGYILDAEEKEGSSVTVIAEAEEGFHVSRYSVETDAGGEEETGFGEKAGRFSYTASVSGGSLKIFSVGFARDEEAAKTGSVAVSVGSAGGKVTVSSGDSTYTIVRAEDGTAAVTDQNGSAAASSAEGFDLVIEDAADSEVLVRAEADKGSEVTMFSVTGTDGLAEEGGFDAGAKLPVFEQKVTVSEGQKEVRVSFIEMPEFNSKAKAGKYLVKIHADKGVLPKGTTAEVKELGKEAKESFEEKTREEADGTSIYVMAVIDITFRDKDGKEIQPAGMVDVVFENAVEDNMAMSVYHAKDEDITSVEKVDSKVEGENISIRNDKFSPYALLAKSGRDESTPNWSSFEKGNRDLIEDAKFVIDDMEGYVYHYGYMEDDPYEGWTPSYSSYLYENGKSTYIGYSICFDPLRDGTGMEGWTSDHVYSLTADMLVKALYYGIGPGKQTLIDILKEGNPDERDSADNEKRLNIVTHAAAAEIYARIGWAKKSSPNDAFIMGDQTGDLKKDAYAFINAIEKLSTPKDYYVYLAGFNDQKRQDFGVLSKVVLKTSGFAKVKKVSTNPSISNGNKCYSLEGARYWAYTSEKAAKARGDAGFVAGATFITDASGVSNTIEMEPGTYYMIEGKAPEGFVRSDDVTQFTVTDGKTTTVNMSDEPGSDPANVYIDKKCKDGEGKNNNSLEGTQFTVSYYDGYYKASSIPSKATRTWVIKALRTSNGLFRASIDSDHLVSGDAFYMDGKIVAVPLGTITIKETKAPDGYINDGSFGGTDMYIGQVRLNDAGTDTVLVDIQGKRTTTNSFEVSDTPASPEIGTTAVDKASGTQTAYAGREVTIEDTVSYKNLIVGNKYVLKGKLVDQKTGETIKDAEGKEVTAETEFTAATINGSVKMLFVFNADSTFAGRTVVAFESVEFENREVAAHAKIDDEPQTIHFPKIRTSAVNPGTKDRILMAAKNAEIEDTVSYENLIPDKEYTLKGVLMVKSTGKPLTVGGKEVTAEKIFSPEKADGKVKVTFRFDATGLENEDLVVFEELYTGTSLIGDHKDLSDRWQTVSFPGVETDAYDKETEKKNTLAAEDRVIVDKVTYKNLIPGKKYEISGEVKIRKEGAGSFEDAETVPSEIVGAEGEGNISYDAEKVIFVPAGNEDETVSGELLVSFKVDASHLAGEEIVVGETVRYNDVEIAVHRDINDKRQSDFVPKGQTMAVDTSTGIKNTLAADNRVFRDTFRYEKLLPGETYRFTGKVMAAKEADEEGNTVLEEIPSVMTDEDGKPVENGCVEFVPSEQDGTIDLYFSIDATQLENRDVTVFEKVTLDGKPVIIHEVLDGTQTLYVPEGGTQVIDSETQDQIAMPDEEVSVIDTLEYKNLIPGTVYTVKGRVMRKSDASEIPSRLTEAVFREGTEGKEISVEDSVATFVPETKDGALELTFVFSASELKGEDVVLFERVYHDDAEVIIHENIDDESQTVHLPDGHTMAADPDTDDRTMKAGGDVTIRDRFLYENLIPGDEYVISGRVMLKPADGEEAQDLEARMVDADGNEVGEWKFTPAEKEGSEDIYFVINSDNLAGRSVVMFETLEFINPELQTRTTLVVHEDIDDEEQTVHFPDGGTTALDSETGSHTSNADEDVTILDEVKFINLIPGKMYTVTGTLMDKETGSPVIIDGKPLTSVKAFTPDTADGSVIIEFTFNGADLAGRSVVAFETVDSNGKEVFVHADLSDEDQTVDFPEVHTSAVDKKDGDREISYKGTVHVEDTVEYRNLMPGTKYCVRGVLMSKSTGQPATAGGKEITGETVFTASGKDGSVRVTFTFNSSDLKDGEYVVFETLYEISAETGDENVVGSHRDINDAAQTVKRHTPPDTPRTGDDNDMWIWLSVFGAALAGAAGAVIIRKKKSGK